MDEEKLIKMFELCIEEEQHHHTMYRNRINYHTGLITALSVAALASIVKAPEQYIFYFLILLGSLMVIISVSGFASASTAYRRWLEQITIRAKLEHLLKMTTSPSSDQKSISCWWASEPLIPLRHLKSREWKNKKERYKSGDEFVNANMRRGSHRWTFVLFCAFGSIGSIFVVISLRKLLGV